MSSIAHPHTPLRSRVRSNRIVMAIGLLLVIVATALVVVLVDGGNESSSSTVTPSSQIGGPNESLRGQSAAGAAGVPGSGGPNEAARGNAASSATR
jgi:hypothetical protein